MVSGPPRRVRRATTILAILDTVMDPEVPVLSVVELGIVRDVAGRRRRSGDGGGDADLLRLSRDAT